MRKIWNELIVEWTMAGAFVALALAALPMTAMAQANPNATSTQTSTERGVTVKVTPKSIGSTDKHWEFAIVLDTHSAALNDDLTQSATLTTDDGRTHKPVSWTGAPPGGHHREGVLTFDASATLPKTIELKIMRPGESAPRLFRWQL